MAHARSSQARLSARLEQAMTLSDLRKRELAAAQRDVRRLERRGALPNPTEYWQRSALPRAAILVDASMAAVVEEGEVMRQAIDRFLDTVERGDLRRWATSSVGRTIIQHAVEQAVVLMTDAVRPADSIHSLGLWWQRRLRRSAALRSLPGILVPGSDAEAVIGRAELALLDGAPWCHGDRLLSAFEIAHGEIKTQAEVVAEELTKMLAVRGATDQIPAPRVTIELRT